MIEARHTPSGCMSCTLGEPHCGTPGSAKVSPGTQLSLRVWVTELGLFFLLGKTRHRPLQKPLWWVTGKMSWHSEVEGGDQGLQQGHVMSQIIPVTASQECGLGFNGFAMWRIPRFRICGMDLIMQIGLPLNFKRVLPTLEKKPSPLRRCENTPPGKQMA